MRRPNLALARWRWRRRRRHVIWGARRGDVVIGSPLDLSIERLRAIQVRRRRAFERHVAGTESLGVAIGVAAEQMAAGLRRVGKSLQAIELEERAKADRRRAAVRRGFEDRDA